MAFIALLVVPLAELWLILQVSERIGVPETLVILVLMSVAGAALLKQQGMTTWRRLQEALRRGEMPTQEATDGALILLGGALLLTPGFLTDAVGFAFVLPPTRAAVKGVARRWWGRRARHVVDGSGAWSPYPRMGSRKRARDGVTATPRWRRRQVPPDAPPGEDDSPDRR
ncbi:hypothetical protein BH24ACT26_BH24ACT26_19150 [soil metagenome]